MLYRSAYAERVKKYCKENNHQVVSQVTGQSWPLEPKEIREMYERFANTERENHQLAHPEYKFAPNKNGKSKRQRDWEEESNPDDPEWEGSRRGGKRSRTREESRSHSSTPFDTGRTVQHPLARYHPSSYQAVNPHGPPPTLMGVDGFAGQYYQTTVTPYGQYAEDVSLRRMEDPFQQHGMGAPLIGLPNGNHNDLLRPDSRVGGEMAVQGNPLDPRLLHYDPRAPAQYEQYQAVDQRYGVQPIYDYGPEHATAVYGYRPEPNYHPGMATLTDGHGMWVPQGEVGSEFDEEFQKWPV